MISPLKIIEDRNLYFNTAQPRIKAPPRPRTASSDAFNTAAHLHTQTLPPVSDQDTAVPLVKQGTCDLALKKAHSRTFHKQQTACPQNALNCQRGHVFLFCYP